MALDIGTQCSLDSCSTHDFLPILCPDCSQYFCKHHIHSDFHSCLPLPQKSGVQHEKLQRCVFNNCNSLTLNAYSSAIAVTCTNCKGSFCAEHRHPVSHKCTPVVDVKLQPNENARQLLTKFSSGSRTRNPVKKITRPPTDPMKLAAYHRVEMIKMQHQAAPLDPKDNLSSPPLDERLHIKFKYREQEKIFWVRKTLIVGKALDLLCVQFDIKNGKSPIQLSKGKPERQIRNDATLLDQVDDGSVLVISQSC